MLRRYRSHLPELTAAAIGLGWAIQLLNPLTASFAQVPPQTIVTLGENICGAAALISGLLHCAGLFYRRMAPVAAILGATWWSFVAFSIGSAYPASPGVPAYGVYVVNCLLIILSHDPGSRPINRA